MLGESLSNPTYAAKAALAAAMALCVLRTLDRRSVTFGFAFWLATLAACCCLVNTWYISSVFAKALWFCAASICLFETAICFHGWLHRKAQPYAMGISLHSAEIAVCIHALLAMTGGVLLFQDSAWSGYVSSFAAVHVVAASLLLGISLSCAVELTFIEAPDTIGNTSTGGLSWNKVMWITFGLIVAECLVCGFVFLRPPSDKFQDPLLALLPRGFFLALLILMFTLWMVPHKVAQAQRGQGPSAWTSLALAAWLSFLSLCAVNALPSDWPWQDL